MTAIRRDHVLYGLVVVVAIVVVGAVATLGPRVLSSCRDERGAGRVLAAFQAEPIVAFTAPGATLETSSAGKARTCHQMGETSSEPTTVARAFLVTTGTAPAVEAYVAAARADGWRPGLVACSRSARSMRVLLTKDVGGVHTVLQVNGTDPFPPEPRRVNVWMSDAAPVLQPSTDETVDDLHCVRPVRPEDPELRVFSATPTRTPEELCGLLSVGGLQSRRIGVTRAIPEVEGGTPQCRYVSGGGQFREQTVLLLQDASTFVPAAYHDRRLPTPAPGGDRLFLVAGKFSTTTRAGAWITTPHAPVLLLYIAEQTDDVVLALSRDVQVRAG